MAFEEDCANGVPADVSWLGTHSSEHPPRLPAGSAQYLALVLDALAGNEDLTSSRPARIGPTRVLLRHPDRGTPTPRTPYRPARPRIPRESRSNGMASKQRHRNQGTGRQNASHVIQQRQATSESKTPAGRSAASPSPVQAGPEAQLGRSRSGPTGSNSRLGDMPAPTSYSRFSDRAPRRSGRSWHSSRHCSPRWSL